MRAHTHTHTHTHIHTHSMHTHVIISLSFFPFMLPCTPHMKVIEASDLFAELFVTSVAMLESDYESEFVMATRLLEKVMGRLDLSKAENEEKLDNLFKKINWSNFPGVQALLMKVRCCDHYHTTSLHGHINQL